MKLFSGKIFSGASGSFSKWQIKIALAVSAFVIVLSVISYTQILVSDLINREQNLINYYAKTYNHFFEGGIEDANIEEFWFFINNIGPTISFPVILTDENNEPQEPFEEYSLNLELDTTQTLDERRQYVRGLIKQMGEKYDPIIVSIGEGEDMMITKFYYTNSDMVQNLRYFPLIAIIIIGAFIMIGYFAFSSVRRTEQSRVWVGMAREAAHQLGTPLSSLLAWIEILKINKSDPDSIESTIGEMGNDLKRLNKITVRFSKIGSMPEKKTTDIVDLARRVCDYFELRLPHLGRKVEIVRKFDNQVFADLNEDLIEWVIENLLKNAAESIESGRGKVTVEVDGNGKKIIILVKDTGKGMTAQQRRKAFSPGYTTKKRGWGLGLSLVKRIIEEYHQGKIYIRETTPGAGTVFAIELPKSNSNS